MWRGQLYSKCRAVLVTGRIRAWILHVLPPNKKQKPSAPLSTPWLWGFFPSMSAIMEPTLNCLNSGILDGTCQNTCRLFFTHMKNIPHYRQMRLSSILRSPSFSLFINYLLPLKERPDRRPPGGHGPVVDPDRRLWTKQYCHVSFSVLPLYKALAEMLRYCLVD